MGISFLCPQCGSELEAELRFAGNQETCPDCGRRVRVPEDAIAPGVLLGGLHLVRCLGKGGMGVVYLARQLAMNRRVAVKILSPDMSGNQLFVKRFMNEALATAKLEHPNIVTIHDAGTVNGFHFLAMEYVDGESLDTRLKREKRLAEGDVLRVALPVAKALAFAWDRHRMLHRDIKPANIMQSSFGEVKLMDLGLAKSAEDPNLTATGIAMGTPLYMSPEQARGEHPLDCRSDMYSLGATIYHLLAGSPPFPGTSAVEIITRHVLEPPPPIHEHNAEVSAPCVHLLDVLLAKKRDQRPADWQAVIMDVERVLEGKPPLTPRPGQPSQRQRQQRRAEALRLAEQAAHEVAARDSATRVAKAIRTERNRRAFLILAVGTFTVAVALFSLGVQMRNRRRPAVPPPAAVVQLPEPAASPPLEPVVAPPPAPPVPEPPPDPVPAPPEAVAVPSMPSTVPPAGAPASPARLAALAPEAAEELPPAPPGPRDAPAYAEQVLRQILDQVVGELYRGNYDAAAAVWAAGTRNLAVELPTERVAAIQARLALLPTMQDRVLNSFAEERGKPVTVQLRNNKITLLVQTVANGRVSGLVQVEQGQFRYSFSLAELNPREIPRRLGSENDPDANFLRGVLAMPGAKPKTAKDLFLLSGGELAEACARLLGEEEARRDFTLMVDELQVGATPRTPEALAEAVRRGNADPAFQLRAQIAAKSFLDNHGGTRFARQYQSLFEAIGTPRVPETPVAPPQPPAGVVAVPPQP
ncbi:MAG: protein kinase [Lentisphaeria bacterium]|jgi:serine/threonine-protein kinase|nr:protein kinase [Lentisphaeria bacterium]